jgi:hypothetical protein
VKKIIDGKAYNTETATLLATVPLKGRKIDERRPGVIITGSEVVAGETKLFESRGGTYFLVREVTMENVLPDPDYVGSLFSPATSGLFPLTRKQAMAWAESKEFDADKIESMFGKIAEAGEKSGTMLLRLPQGLKASVDLAAASANQSANAYAMRCLELCVNDIPAPPTIRKALAYAIVAIERLPDEWREESDKEHMRKLFEAMTPGPERDYYITTARSHLERRGIAIEDGKLVPAPRDSGTVVPLK